MKTHLIRESLILTASVCLVGCAAHTFIPESDRQHPANAQAPASPLLPWESGLLNLTNLTVAGPTAAGDGAHKHHEK